MNIKIKPYRYYKRYYTDSNDYDIHYTDDTWCYRIAIKYRNRLLIKCNGNVYWEYITNWQYQINKHRYNVEEVSIEDVFLELL